MEVEHIIALLATGAGAGFFSGLLGIGGGFIVVPVSYWVVVEMGLPHDIALRVAFGTSLLVILPTVISAGWRHNKEGVIRWKVAFVLGGCGLMGSLGGSTLAAYLAADVLKLILGSLFLAVALWMGFGRRRMAGQVQDAGGGDGPVTKKMLWISAGCGFPIGLLVGLTGVGGGGLIVPVLALILHFSMHVAVGTSLAAVMFTCLGGIVGYIVNGIGMSPLPYSLGYINLPMWLCLTATSIPLAQLGARVSHALSAKWLNYLFIAFSVYVGLRMIGVF